MSSRPTLAVTGATGAVGGPAAVSHLLDLGHQRIAFIGGQRSAACSQGRLAGYRTGLEQAGLTPEPSLVEYGDFGWGSGLRHGTALLDRPSRPSAVFAASDATALGVLEAAGRLGLWVPEDPSVVGFDDTHLAAWSTPPLTTVNQPLKDMGRSHCARCSASPLERAWTPPRRARDPPRRPRVHHRVGASAVVTAWRRRGSWRPASRWSTRPRPSVREQIGRQTVEVHAPSRPHRCGCPFPSSKGPA